MPGYGYAEAPKAIKRDWQGLMLDYLRGGRTCAGCCCCLDARVEVKTADETVLGLLDQAAVAYQIVLTKADALKPGALARKQAAIGQLALAHPAALNEVIVTSSTDGLGIEALRASIAGFAGG